MQVKHQSPEVHRTGGWKNLQGQLQEILEKIILLQENEETFSIQTNLQRRSGKHAQPQSAVTEQRFCATSTVARYVGNALQQFAQTVLIEHKLTFVL